VIVVDTNLLVYLLHVEGQRTAEAEAVLRRDAAWAAPVLWRSEFRSILAGLVPRRVLTLDDALRIVVQVEVEHGMAGREYTEASSQVLLLVPQSSCSAYDCEFVSLARDLEVPLVTADRRVLNAFPSVAIAPVPFAA
jgi:predicted nucleic acid-binding protein